ncbi:MAG: hypothetical protein ACK5MK_12585 [Dysgonomonas sp.]
MKTIRFGHDDDRRWLLGILIILYILVSVWALCQEHKMQVRELEMQTIRDTENRQLEDLEDNHSPSAVIFH